MLFKYAHILWLKYGWQLFLKWLHGYSFLNDTPSINSQLVQSQIMFRAKFLFWVRVLFCMTSETIDGFCSEGKSWPHLESVRSLVAMWRINFERQDQDHVNQFRIDSKQWSQIHSAKVSTHTNTLRDLFKQFFLKHYKESCIHSLYAPIHKCWLKFENEYPVPFTKKPTLSLGLIKETLLPNLYPVFMFHIGLLPVCPFCFITLITLVVLRLDWLNQGRIALRPHQLCL